LDQCALWDTTRRLSAVHDTNGLASCLITCKSYDDTDKTLILSEDWRLLLSTLIVRYKCYRRDLPFPPLDNIRVMVIVWRLRGNIIRTAPCWVVWHNVHSHQHTHMSSSYRSSRLALSHWDPYAMCEIRNRSNRYYLIISLIPQNYINSFNSSKFIPLNYF